MVSRRPAGDPGLRPVPRIQNLHPRQDEDARADRYAGAQTPTPMVDTKKAAQRSILDYVKNDLTRFGKIVGTADRANIDRHLGYVRDIEMGLQDIMSTGGDAGTGTVGTGAACGVPAAATATAVAFKNTDNIPVITKLHMDLAVAAFAADLTRVAVMQISDQGAAHLILSWAPCNFKSGGPNPGDANTGDANGFHAIAHGNMAARCNATPGSRARSPTSSGS